MGSSFFQGTWNRLIFFSSEGELARIPGVRCNVPSDGVSPPLLYELLHLSSNEKKIFTFVKIMLTVNDGASVTRDPQVPS